MRGSINLNKKNKYNNNKVYVLMDEDGELYPFKTKRMANMFLNQNMRKIFKELKFDSKLEFSRYKYLHMLEKEGIIEDLKTQVVFELIPSQGYTETTILPNGSFSYKKRSMAGTKYIADFTYTYDGKEIVEDTKSDITRKKPDYRIKKKLMLLKHDILIKEVDRKCVNTL